MGIGVGVGAVMTAGTHGAYAIGVKLVPSLPLQVTVLYIHASTQSVLSALSWTLVILIAEEILWRGALLNVLERRVGRKGAIALSLATYTLAQAGAGSLIVALAALVCGAIWTAERVYTSSSLAPLISHTMWTLTVIHLVPVIQLNP